MLPGMELMACPELAVSKDVMRHVVQVESSRNPYAIGVVGGRLQRQPKNLPEALATVQMLESKGFNFSVGIAQVNRYNLEKYGLDSYTKAFQVCPNLQAGAKILAECYQRHQDWGKSFSCYYSGNPVTGFRHGYVQKIFASMATAKNGQATDAIPVTSNESRKTQAIVHYPTQSVPSRVEPGISRIATTTPQSRPAVLTDPAFAGAGATAAVLNQTAAAPAAGSQLDDPVATGEPVDAQYSQANNAGPVRLQPTMATPQPAAAVPPEIPAGDNAFVF